MRQRRIKRIRARVVGTKQRPRLAVTRTNRNIFVQFIDDATNATLAASSTLKSSKGTKTEQAAKLGELIGKLAASKKITKVVFDRRGYAYHGRIKTLAEAARKAGLQF